MSSDITADGWFSPGERVPYDRGAKKVLHREHSTTSPDVVNVFRRIENGNQSGIKGACTTFLPGFPDGSFGWARVDRYLSAPRIFVEYVGQGDSDKPSNYPYGTMERADLVEAIWREQGIRSTFLVTFDYSSLVALELLSRQQDCLEKDIEPFTRIEKVMMINGGLFADAHSHPWNTTPLLNTFMGRMGTWMAQRSRTAFNQMVGVLWSKEYKVTHHELEELYKAISRHNGAAFMSNGAGFVIEHKANAERWDLRRLFLAMRDSVSFHVIGSEGDPFEPNQVIKARERLGEYGLDIRMLPGGHLTTSEHPEQLAEIIREVEAETEY